MKKFLSVCSLVSVLLLSACASQPSDESVPLDSAMPAIDSDVDEMMVEDDEEGMMDSSDAMMPSSPAMMQNDDAAMMKSDTKVVNVTATNFAFTPNMIRVKKGEKVQLNFASAEGSHGVAIKDLGINVSFAAGQTKSIDLPTDQAGTFAFKCSVPCGSGHKDMIGTIVVE